MTKPKAKTEVVKTSKIEVEERLVELRKFHQAELEELTQNGLVRSEYLQDLADTIKRCEKRLK
jgi:hypothetical protein